VTLRTGSDLPGPRPAPSGHAEANGKIDLAPWLRPAAVNRPPGRRRPEWGVGVSQSCNHKARLQRLGSIHLFAVGCRVPYCWYRVGPGGGSPRRAAGSQRGSPGCWAPGSDHPNPARANL